jgi:hypothetical protein
MDSFARYLDKALFVDEIATAKGEDVAETAVLSVNYDTPWSVLYPGGLPSRCTITMSRTTSSIPLQPGPDAAIVEVGAPPPPPPPPRASVQKPKKRAASAIRPVAETEPEKKQATGPEFNMGGSHVGGNLTAVGGNQYTGDHHHRNLLQEQQHRSAGRFILDDMEIDGGANLVGGDLHSSKGPEMGGAAQSLPKSRMTIWAEKRLEEV